MAKLPFPIAPGHRTVIAMTCSVCGQLRPGSEFERWSRLKGQPPYLDRRCKPCRWKDMELKLVNRRPY